MNAAVTESFESANMELPDKVKELALAGEKIKAIQCLKQATGMDLRSAKQVVEDIMARKEVRLGTPAPASREDETKEQRIRRQLVDLGRTGQATMFNRKEILALPSVLNDDEDVLDLVSGSYAGGSGILVATQTRLIFMDKGMLYGLRVEDFPYIKISSIQYQTGLLLGTITIFTSGNKAEIKNVEKQFTRSFAEGARVRISAADQPKRESPSAVSPSGIDDLERLASLRNKGILTEEEFIAKKRQILGI